MTFYGKLTKTQESITYKRAKGQSITSWWPQGCKKQTRHYDNRQDSMTDKHKLQITKRIHKKAPSWSSQEGIYWRA